MTSDALSWFRWFHDNAKRIRKEAGRDAARLEALIDDPALAQEALDQFPDSPQTYLMLKEYMYPERLLARRGIFFIDLPPAEDEHAEFRRQDHELVEGDKSQRGKTENDF